MPAGPFAGLFGGRGQSTHNLDFRGALFVVNQQVRLPDEAGESAEFDTRFLEGRHFGGASATLDYSYSRSGTGSSFSVNGRGSISDYSVNPSVPDVSFNAGTTVSTNLTRRIAFNASAGAAYSPFFSFGAPTRSSARQPSTPPSGFQASLLLHSDSGT